jgi:hypothetical protein
MTPRTREFIIALGAVWIASVNDEEKFRAGLKWINKKFSRRQ